MKMSKSINDYKEAMDNIKISESFYKRTEVLLTEIPEVKIEKRPVLNGRRVSAVIMSAAACVICLFGVKLALDGRQADIVTETVTDTDSGDAGGDITETGRKADELIDDFEYEDDIIAESMEPDSLDGGSDVKAQDASDSVKPVAANPATSSDTEVTTAGTTVSDTPAETKPTAPAKETKSTTTASEKPVVGGKGTNSSSSNTTSEQNNSGKTEEPFPMPNPGASGGVSTDGEEADDMDIMEDAEEENDEATPVASEGAENTRLFSELSLNNITVDITPYFNMGDIKSGEGTVKKSGTEFQSTLDLISNLKNEPSVTKINNSSFTSLFSIRIYDANIDLDFYSIYLTNSSTIVITKHSPDGTQVRETYTLRKEYYESVRHQLFLLFGAESDYELFTNLIGGK